MNDYDFIIIGSGAGGSAAAYRLASAGRSVLLLEKGAELPRDGSTLDIGAVASDSRYNSRERWRDGSGRTLVPQEHFNLGGKTKWYGAALLRFAPEEFEGDAAAGLLSWPISYEDLRPYYDEAEALLGVTRFKAERGLRRLLADLAAVEGDWTSEPLPLGLKPEILAHAEEARHFDGFASPLQLKGDAETAFLSRVRHLPNLRILTGQSAARLLPAEGDPRRVEGVLCEDGRAYRAEHILLAAGALHSPGLVDAYLAKTGLDRRLASADRVGRYYKSHLKTFLLTFSREPQTDLLRKTVLLSNPRFPRSSIQTLGWIDGEILASQSPGWVPRRLLDALGRRAYGFFLQTEDGSHPANRVRRAVNGQDLPLLDFRAERVPRSRDEHRALTTAFRRALRRAGYFTAAKPVPVAGSAHACGTLAAGTDPRRSVVDGSGRVYGFANLYVADGSALPRSSRVNPALTIYAWALRVADRLAGFPHPNPMLPGDPARPPSGAVPATKSAPNGFVPEGEGEVLGHD